MRVLILLAFIISGCASKSSVHREPSSQISYNPCTQGVQAFFDESRRREIAAFSESNMIERGLLNEGELEGHLNDPVYRHLIQSEDETLRRDTAKIIALLRRYKPDYDPKKITDLYHKLFHSCKL